MSITLNYPKENSIVDKRDILLNVSTNKDAICYYQLFIETPNLDLTEMSITGKRGHFHSIEFLENNVDYLLQVECVSGEERENIYEGFHVSWNNLEARISIATKLRYYYGREKIELT